MIGSKADEYNIVFSMPVHEKAEVVLDSAINHLAFNPSSAVILHLSKNFNWKDSRISEEKFYEAVKKLKDLYVNPTSIESSINKLAFIHLMNFEYADKILNFKYFITSASNQLFVKSGLIEYLLQSGKEAYLKSRDLPEKHWASSTCLSNQYFKKFVKDCEISKLKACQIEGACFKHSLMTEIKNMLYKHFDFENANKCQPWEEILFATAAFKLVSSSSIENRALVYINWYDSLRVYSCKLPLIVSNYWGVKRIGREISNNERIYIRTKIGNYTQLEKSILGSIVVEKPLWLLWLCSFTRFIGFQILNLSIKLMKNTNIIDYLKLIIKK